MLNRSVTGAILDCTGKSPTGNDSTIRELLMPVAFEIVPERPFEDGVEQGRQLGKTALLAQIDSLLRDAVFADTFGAMARAEVTRYVMGRLETAPDYGVYPELADLFPERVEAIRGFAEGADCSLHEAAIHNYLTYKHWSITFWQQYQVAGAPVCGHCSHALLIGPDGILGGQCLDSAPSAKPADYRHRPTPSHGDWLALPTIDFHGTIRKPRTGYIEQWGYHGEQYWGNEKGLAYMGGGTVGMWLDDPPADVWPCQNVPLLRFAADVHELVALAQRYKLHTPGGGSSVYADISGNAVVVEKSLREVDFRLIGNERALWCTEGYYHTPKMSALLNDRRKVYLERAGLHPGSPDMQYFTDCIVRFGRLAELCHEEWGFGYAHLNKILTDHAPFPRALCRHGGPDTAPYDETITLMSWIHNVTYNRSHIRQSTPWQQFCCEVPWTVEQYPERP